MAASRGRHSRAFSTHSSDGTWILKYDISGLKVRWPDRERAGVEAEGLGTRGGLAGVGGGGAN